MRVPAKEYIPIETGPGTTLECGKAAAYHVVVLQAPGEPPMVGLALATEPETGMVAVLDCGRTRQLIAQLFEKVYKIERGGYSSGIIMPPKLH